MKPFNIQIDVESTPITITVLPTDEGFFKVIYYGGIVGAISLSDQTKEWKLVPPAQVEAGDLPTYTVKSEDDQLPLELNSEMIVKIGRQIEKTALFNK